MLAVAFTFRQDVIRIILVEFIVYCGMLFHYLAELIGFHDLAVVSLEIVTHGRPKNIIA